MRHILIRTITSFIWLGAAVVNGISGNFSMSALFVLLGGVFLYSAHAAWKQENNSRGDR